MNFNLYDVQGEKKIYEMITNHDSANEIFEHLEGTFEEKIIWISKYYKNLEAESASVKSALDDMKKRYDYVWSIMEDAKNFMMGKIKSTGLLDPIKAPEFCIRVKNNPEALVIEKPELIPDVYKITTAVITFDKNAIKKDISEGFDVEGVRLERKTRLEIK